jgi:hypothetical protein
MLPGNLHQKFIFGFIYLIKINQSIKNKRNMKKLLFTIVAAAFVVLFYGCNKTIDTDSPGRLIINVTDAPFLIDYVESATVTITKVEIKKAGDGVCDGTPFLVLSEDTVTFDLLDLRNGVVDKLVDIEVPAGEYDQIRLYVDQAGLKVKEGGDYSVKVPSGKQTGIKVIIHPGLFVEGGLTSEVLLDFDLSRSFVLKGNLWSPAGIKGFNFKPVIRAVNNTTAGRIEGMVTDTSDVKVKEANVWVEQDTVVATTIADTMGYYAIIGLPAGNYSVFATKEDYDTVSFDDIKVIAGNRTIVDFALTKKE